CRRRDTALEGRSPDAMHSVPRIVSDTPWNGQRSEAHRLYANCGMRNRAKAWPVGHQEGPSSRCEPRIFYSLRLPASKNRGDAPFLAPSKLHSDASTALLLLLQNPAQCRPLEED